MDSQQKIILNISGMHCTSCAMNIDGELEDTAGVIRCSTNYARQKTEVVFEPDLVSLEQIFQAIKKLGYEAVPVKTD